MSSETTPADLLDLKMLPAWASEAAPVKDYANFAGEEFSPRDRRDGGRDDRRERPRRPAPSRDGKERRPRPEGRREERSPRPVQRERETYVLPNVAIRFVPRPGAFGNVAEQIKHGAVAYSVFALARLFLDKPERYEVKLQAAEGATLFQLGEHGAVTGDRRLLEGSAFAETRDEYYTTETTQTEPLKGNFTNVARCRLSGTLLGPTNHHAYQPQLRSLYEQRFSRRMSFQDYQRQIDVVSDPAAIEAWKEQARSVTTYATKNEEAPVTFSSLAAAEQHFRQHHLPQLIREVSEATINGVTSRQLPDRGIARVIENSWATEIRSPSKMMQEIAGGLRNAGLNIFRHRRGMLYVSPIRARTFGHERATVSTSVNALLEKVSATPGIGRKLLAEQMMPEGTEPVEAERIKRALVSDLRWLISEGYVIEFNDGSLDLPRSKVAPAEASEAPMTVASEEPAPNPEQVESAPTTSENDVPAALEAQSQPVQEATATAPQGEPTSEPA